MAVIVTIPLTKEQSISRIFKGFLSWYKKWYELYSKIMCLLRVVLGLMEQQPNRVSPPPLVLKFIGHTYLDKHIP
jgi:hypothetical protein